MNKLGLYLHIPFCRRKCHYCAFYSSPPLADEISLYAKALGNLLRAWSPRLTDYSIDSVYFGGGTPSLLSPRDLDAILSPLSCLHVEKNCEITLECNPDSLTLDHACSYHALGINRISIGMQSAVDSELSLLGRLHTHKQTESAVEACRKAGILNISLDLMQNIPSQTQKSRLESLLKAINLSTDHISVYGLKIEENTPFFENRPPMPSEEEEWIAYDETFAALEKHGYRQYEISNAAKSGFESRHNQKYWRRDETLGLGPAAHSFFAGKRFYYPTDTAAFIAGTLSPLEDAPLTAQDEAEEEVMLGLRLTDGIDLSQLPFDPDIHAYAKKLSDAGYCRLDGNRLSLTRKGFFVSNTVISTLINHLKGDCNA